MDGASGAAPRSTYPDATALIGLARIDRLDLLAVLPRPVCVTAQVWQEVAGDPTKAGVTALLRARDQGVLLVVGEGDPGAYPQLDPGESTVLSAAAAAGAVVLLDERKARALIDTRAELRAAIPHAIGLLGLLLLAKRRGQIDAVRPLLDRLVGQRFWISTGLYRAVLHQAGET